MGEALSDQEQHAFFDMLVRLCEHHIDQFEFFRIDAPSGPWYMELSMKPVEGLDAQYYVDIPGALMTNRTARNEEVVRSPPPRTRTPWERVTDASMAFTRALAERGVQSIMYSHTEDEVTVAVTASPVERWDVTFGSDGDARFERFVSAGPPCPVDVASLIERV